LHYKIKVELKGASCSTVPVESTVAAGAVLLEVLGLLATVVVLYDLPDYLWMLIAKEVSRVKP
jgi:hypothetical protein